MEGDCEKGIALTRIPRFTGEPWLWLDMLQQNDLIFYNIDIGPWLDAVVSPEVLVDDRVWQVNSLRRRVGTFHPAKGADYSLLVPTSETSLDAQCQVIEVFKVVWQVMSGKFFLYVLLQPGPEHCPTGSLIPVAEGC